jgi:hypothetical protein
MINRVRGTLLSIGLAFLGIFGIFVVDNYAVVSVTSTPAQAIGTPSVTTVPVKVSCMTSKVPFYFANVPTQAKEGRRSFGPPMNVTKIDNPDRRSGLYTTPFTPISAEPKNVGAELAARLCGRKVRNGRHLTTVHGPDKSLYLALAMAAEGRDPRRPLSDKEWEDGVNYAVTEGIQYDRVITERVITAPKGWTTYMEPGADMNQAPRIGVTKFAHWESWITRLSYRLPNGKIIELTARADCGNQFGWSSKDAMPKVARQLAQTHA